MARTTAGQYQFDVETYLSGTLLMTAYPSDFESVSQVLVPATEYYSVFVQQSQIIRTQDANAGLVELDIRVRLLYRIVTNEAEYMDSSTTPSKHKAAMAVLMDEQFWRGKAGSLTLTAPLDVSNIELPESAITRTLRVIETAISLTLVTASV